MKPGRIAAIVIGVLLAVPALGLVVGGVAVTVGDAAERDDGGYFDATLERLSTPTAAITTGEADLRADPGPPDRVLDFVDFDRGRVSRLFEWGHAPVVGNVALAHLAEVAEAHDA